MTKAYCCLTDSTLIIQAATGGKKYRHIICRSQTISSAVLVLIQQHKISNNTTRIKMF